MHRNPSSRSPSRSDRKTIALLTVFFVMVSAAFHFLAGNFGIRSLAWRSVEASPTPRFIDVIQLEKPTPTPTPTATPTPAPSSPRPTIAPVSSTRAPARPVNVKPPVRRNAGGPPTVALYTAAPGAPTATEPPQLPPAAEPPAPSPTPVEARDMIIAAEFNHRVIPPYPSMAVDARWEGTVLVLVTIGPDGVIEAHVGTSSGYAVLDRAALRAAEESTYRPPELNGKPAIETYRVIYSFNLSDA